MDASIVQLDTVRHFEIGFHEIWTPISKLWFVAITGLKIPKPKELTSQVSRFLRLILLVSENLKNFEIFGNTHRWWRVDHGDQAIFHGTSPIPSDFTNVSPPDPNMSTYLDRWDPHLSISIIFLIQLQVGSEKTAIRYNRKLIFWTLLCCAHFTQKTYNFQKIVTPPFLGQNSQMIHQNVPKK